ncbi:MAG TPA: hypothetical protein VIG64_14690 [Actinomycetota bacterium]
MAVLVALGLGACSSSQPEPPRPGDAFARPAVGDERRIELPPGQEVVQVLYGLQNASEEPLEITKLRAVPGAGIPDAAQIVQVSLLSSEGPHLPGVYVTFPPVTRAEGKCVRADVLAPRETTVEPGSDVFVLLWLRSVAEGRAEVTGLRVRYEQAGVTYEQGLDLGPPTELHIDLDDDVVAPSRDERACASQARFLPGSVRY